MTFGNKVFAFQSCDNNEQKCINSDTPFEKKIINHENFAIETKCPNLNLCNVNNCKYYTIDELQSSKDMGNFNIFHNNLNGLGNKFEVLYNFLMGTPKHLIVWR